MSQDEQRGEVRDEGAGGMDRAAHGVQTALRKPGTVTAHRVQTALRKSGTVTAHRVQTALR